MARYLCPGCDYVYDEETGDPREGWPAGTTYSDLDPEWACPDCGVREAQDFIPENDPTDATDARSTP